MDAPHSFEKGRPKRLCTAAVMTHMLDRLTICPTGLSRSSCPRTTTAHLIELRILVFRERLLEQVLVPEARRFDARVYTLRAAPSGPAGGVEDKPKNFAEVLELVH